MLWGGVCDVNKVSEKVNERCVCESVGPTDEREKIKGKKERKKRKKNKVRLWVVWGREIGEILEWCEKKESGVWIEKIKSKMG